MTDIVTDIKAIYNELFKKLKTDSRVPRFAAYVDGPVIGEPQQYPILYFETGADRNKQFTTASRDHAVRSRVRFFVKFRNPEEGQDKCEDMVLAIVKALTETANDRRLVVSGTALAQNVECPEFAWGVFTKDSRSHELIFSGTIEIVVSLVV